MRDGRGSYPLPRHLSQRAPQSQSVTRGHTAPRGARDASQAPHPPAPPAGGSGTARDGSSSSSICFAACLLPQPHVFNSTGRSLALADQNKTAFPRTEPGGGREEERSRGNPLSASPGEDEPGCPPPSVPAPHAPGCPCPPGLQGGTPAAVPVGPQALRDGGSPRDTGQGVRYRSRAGAAKPACCSGSPHWGSRAERQPATPAAQESSAPGSVPNRTHPAAQYPDTQVCAVTGGTAIRRRSSAAALPQLSPVTHPGPAAATRRPARRSPGL